MKENKKGIRCVEVEFMEENPYDFYKTYTYKCPFEVEVGDVLDVAVNSYTGQRIKNVKVIKVHYYTEETAPYPLEKMKTIKSIVKRQERDFNSPETLRKIAKIRNLDIEIDNYCIKELGYDHSILKNHMLGDCNMWWYAKKRVLKEKYNIDWLTPNDCNPDVFYD